MEGVVTSIGWRLPAFSGAAFGNRGRGGPQGSRRRYRGFAGSSDLVALCQQALQRLQNSIDVANDACSGKKTLDFLTGAATLNWILGNNTSTASACSAAAQMQVGYDDYSAKVNDPDTTDDTLGDILTSINKYADVSDLLALAKATGGAAAAQLALQAPGAAVGAIGAGLGDVLGGILKNIPWWVWAAGAAYLAFDLGIVGGAARRIRERAA